MVKVPKITSKETDLCTQSQSNIYYTHHAAGSLPSELPTLNANQTLSASNN
jgi:hypothetical protein